MHLKRIHSAAVLFLPVQVILADLGCKVVPLTGASIILDRNRVDTFNSLLKSSIQIQGGVYTSRCILTFVTPRKTQLDAKTD